MLHLLSTLIFSSGQPLGDLAAVGVKLPLVSSKPGVLNSEKAGKGILFCVCPNVVAVEFQLAKLEKKLCQEY